MLQIRHQDQVHQLRQDQHNDGNTHRRTDILIGIKTRCQHLDSDQAEQPQAVTHERTRGLQYVAVSESAVVVERCDQRLRKGQQRHRAGHRQQDHQPQAPVQHG